MAKPDTEREKELIEAFEIVLSYVKRVYSVEYDRPVGFIVRRLLACVEEKPIEVGENLLPGKEIKENSPRKCGLCKCEICGTEHDWRDEEWRLHVVCERCFDALKKKFGGNWRGDRSVFKEANHLPGQDVREDSRFTCDVCLREVFGVKYTRFDERGILHVVCKRCSDGLKKMYGRNGKPEVFMFG